MRYLIVTYMRRAAGRRRELQQDEVVQVARRLRPRDISEGSVILDFRDHQVIKASLGDQAAPRDFQRIRDYYYTHYRDVIDQLESANAPVPQQ